MADKFGYHAALADFLYRRRWPLSAVMLLAVTALQLGGGLNLQAFSAKVDKLADAVPEKAPPPRVFDARYDIWFDPQDAGLRTYKDVEDQFIAEDVLIVAFEDTKDPLGVFGTKALTTIAELTAQIEKVPFVRNVRSLTQNPWIRWEDAGPEPGLVVGDLFDKAPASYSDEERLSRMIAILGAKRVSGLVGDERVRAVLGVGRASGVNEKRAAQVLAKHTGEPRLIDSIVSGDGRTAAIQVQILRPKIASEQLDATFGAGDAYALERMVGASVYTNESQWKALAAVKELAAQAQEASGYAMHLAGMPALERNFMVVGMEDMVYVVIMFAVIAMVLLALYRRFAGMLMPLVVVFSAIMGMMGTIFLAGDLLNNLTAVAPNMMTAVGIADAVHLVTAYYILRPAFHDRDKLIREVLHRNVLPVFLTSVTTAVGFFSLTTSNIVPMRMLGYTGGVGTLYAFLLSMTVVPALLSLIPLRSKRADGRAAGPDEVKADGRFVGDQLEEEDSQHTRLSALDRGPHWTDGVMNVVLGHRKAIVVASLGLVAAAVVGVTQIEISSDFRQMFPMESTFSKDLHWIEKKIGGTGDLELVFYGPVLKDSPKDVAGRQTRIETLQVKRLEAREVRSGDRGLSAAERQELAQLERAEAAHQRRRIAASHQFLSLVDRFQRQVDAERHDASSPLRVLTSFDSALAVLRKLHQVQNENRPAYYRIPGPGDIPRAARAARLEYDPFTEEAILIPGQTAASMASQYYLQYENGAKPTENLSMFVTAERRGFRIAARVTSASALVHQAAYARLKEIAQTIPGFVGTSEEVEAGKAMATMTMTGKHYLFTNMIQRFSKTLIMSLSLALTVITLLIGFIYRSFRIALVSLVPNVLPLTVPLAMFGFLGMPMDGPAVLVVSIALGVCVDDTIHLFTKFVQARNKGLDADAALRWAFRHIGGAISTTSVVLMIGFGVLTLSDFRPNALIGWLGAIMIGLAWFFDFVTTPALLSLTTAPGRSPASVTATKSKAVTSVGVWLLAGFTGLAAGGLLGAGGSFGGSVAQAASPPAVPSFEKGDAAKYGLQLAMHMDAYDQGWVDMYSKSKMTLFDARGDSVQREVLQMVLEGRDGDKSIVRFMKPAEIRGVAALTHEHPQSTDENWLYLPSSRRVRRVSGANRTASFQGTEFTYEDLSSLTVSRYNWRFLREDTRDGEPVFVLEAIPNYSDTGYSRLVLQLHQKHWRVEQVDYFDKAGKALKSLRSSNWQQYHGRYWRANVLDMDNHQTRKRTRIELSAQFLDLSRYKKRNGRARANLTSAQFTRKALEGS